MATYEGTNGSDVFAFQGWPPPGERLDARKGFDWVAISDDWSNGAPATIRVRDADFVGFKNLEALQVEARQASIILGSAASAAFSAKQIEVHLDASGPGSTIRLDASGLAAGRSVNASIGAVSDYESIAFDVTGSGGNDVFADIGRSSYSSANVSIRIDGGAGNDRFSIYQAALEKVTRLEGGSGKDSLEIFADDAIIDAHFANVSGFETLSVHGNLTLGREAQEAFTTARIQVTHLGTTFDSTAMDASRSVDLRAQADSIRTGAGDDIIRSNELWSSGIAKRIETGAGNDTIIFSEPGQLAGGTYESFKGVELLDGGAGTDTLRFTGGARLTDQSFANTKNLEAIKIGGGDWDLSFGANVKAGFTGGLINVWGDSASSLKVTADGAVLGLRINVVGTAGNDTITGGSGADVFQGGEGDDVLIGGGGNDTFTFSSGTAFDGGDTIDGGEGYDQIRLLGDTFTEGLYFSGVRGIEAVSMGPGYHELHAWEETGKAFTGGHVYVNAASADATFVTANLLDATSQRFTFKGGAGEDRVALGGSLATVTGGGGADTFIWVENGFTKGIVTDFANGVDHLNLARSALEEMSDAQLDALLSSASRNTAQGLEIDGAALGLGGTLVLAGMTKAQFDHGDIVFG